MVAILAAISIPVMRGRIDAAKWSEGKAMMGTIATAIRAYHADKGADAAPPTAIVGTGDTALGFAATDLEGTYFQSSDFSMNVTSMNPLIFTITCTSTKSNAPANPKTVTLNQNGVWTP
jgi:type IV pilus assembly protein PilA